MYICPCTKDITFESVCLLFELSRKVLYHFAIVSIVIEIKGKKSSTNEYFSGVEIQGNGSEDFVTFSSRIFLFAARQVIIRHVKGHATKEETGAAREGNEVVSRRIISH